MSAADAIVCEWAADPDLAPAGVSSLEPATSVAATGFVDFDAIETVRASSVSASWR